MVDSKYFSIFSMFKKMVLDLVLNGTTLQNYLMFWSFLDCPDILCRGSLIFCLQECMHTKKNIIHGTTEQIYSQTEPTSYLIKDFVC